LSFYGTSSGPPPPRLLFYRQQEEKDWLFYYALPPKHTHTSQCNVNGEEKEEELISVAVAADV
jgi:hypothetical protein